MEPSDFKGTAQNPYHLSVGVVLQNDKGEVCCHEFGDTKLNPIHPEKLYILMRESVENGESIRETAERGLREEFGATGSFQSFLGSIVSHFQLKTGQTAEKTTLYLHYKLEHQDTSLRVNDEEAESTLLWLPVDDLIGRIKHQQQFLAGRTDANETSLLERVR